MAFSAVRDSQPEIAGAISLTATVFSRTAGAARTRWNGVPVFWRAQIVGWSLFAIVDLVNLRLLYHEFPTAFRRTVLITACLVLISTGMRRIYASRPFGNTLTRRAIAGITLPNAASIALHERFGFTSAGVMHDVGRKLGRYWDVAWYQKRL